MKHDLRKKKNIVLIGFMATGKTSAGKMLAQRLGREFIDTDALVEKKMGMSVSDIFTQYGEETFRKREADAVAEVASEENLVIATGGGIVLNPENIRRLREKGLLVLLETSPIVIARRVSNKKDRPLLSDSPELIARIEELLAARESFYKGDLEIETSDLSCEEVVEKILAFLQKDDEIKEGELS